jgi:hypothetical protein
MHCLFIQQHHLWSNQLFYKGQAYVGMQDLSWQMESSSLPERPWYTEVGMAALLDLQALSNRD